MPKRRREPKSQEVYEVERIVSHVRDDSGLWYKVKWLGYDEKDNTFELEANVDGCPELVADYWASVGRPTPPIAAASALATLLDGTSSGQLREQIRLMCKNDLKDVGCSLIDSSVVADMGKEMTLRVAVNYKKLRDASWDALKVWEQAMTTLSAKEGEASVQVENAVDLEGPPRGFVFVTRNQRGQGVLPEQPPPLHCVCAEADCGVGANCCPATNEADFAYSLKYRRARNCTESTPIYECNDMCTCGPTCPNRVVQNGRRVAVCIFRCIDTRGWGLKTLANISKNEFVTEYVGELIPIAEAELRESGQSVYGKSSYLFDLDYDQEPTYSLDAMRFGNVAHFINHSCAANLRTRMVWVNNLDRAQPRVAFFAARDIKKGEELTFDYNPSLALESAAKLRERAASDDWTPCCCGAPNCREILWVLNRRAT